MGKPPNRPRQQFLKPLKRKGKRKPFAVYDLETTNSNRDVYLAGFFDGTLYRHFESRPMPAREPGSAVDLMLRWILENRLYLDTRLYAHNAGNFDALYLLDWFRAHAKDYRLQITPIQSTILILEASLASDEDTSWTFLDSARLVPAKLEDLATKFLGLQSGKLKVDYATLHQNPLRFEYLENDCRILFQALTKVYDLVEQLGGEVGVTAPATAMLLFRKRHLSTWLEINRHHGGCKCVETP